MDPQTLEEGTYSVLAADVRSSGEPGMSALREVAASEEGIEIGPTASGVVLAFRSAARAVRCAVAIQELQELPAQLAIGLHAGEIRAGEGAGARAVTVAARLATLARGGQILASELIGALGGEDRELGFNEGREVSLPGLAGRLVVREVRRGSHGGGRCAW